MIRRVFAILALMCVVGGPIVVTAQAQPDPQERVVLYFFWGEDCPHCAAAKPVLAELETRYPQLEVRAFEVWKSPENRQLLIDMAAKFGFTATGVPTFFLGREYWVGFMREVTARRLEAAIQGCLATGCPDAGAGVVESDRPPPEAPASKVQESGPDPLRLPFVGEVDLGSKSLVATTLLIAVVDGFNPCSLWVLSVLLALTLRTRSRRKIAVIGSVYIFVSALVYALFIAGLFSVFAVVALAPWVRVAVVLIAGVFGAVNIKDYFWFKKGPSLSIPESRKPGIYQRMRRVLAAADSPPALIASTAVLAAGVSFVELGCTAGFPVLWTNILADREVTPMVFAALLALYMLIYQLDELAIFGGAVITMRASRLQDNQGRLLKLAGGTLMLSLAIVMAVDPALMSDIRSVLVVFAAAVLATAVLVIVRRILLTNSDARSLRAAAEAHTSTACRRTDTAARGQDGGDKRPH